MDGDKTVKLLQVQLQLASCQTHDNTNSKTKGSDCPQPPEKENNSEEKGKHQCRTKGSHVGTEMKFCYVRA